MGPDFQQPGNLVTVNPDWIKVNLSFEFENSRTFDANILIKITSCIQIRFYFYFQ